MPLMIEVGSQNQTRNSIFRSGFRRSCAIALIAILVTTATPAKAAVFGRDQRIRLDDTAVAITANVGVLVSSQTGALCSAFCLSPDVIATAGHCVNGTSPSARPDLGRLRFTPSSDQSGRSTAIKGSTNGTQSQNIITGSNQLRLEPPINAADDWAVIKLEAPACTAGGFAVTTKDRDTVTAATANGALYQVASHRDLADVAPRVATECALSPTNTGSVATDARHDFSDWPSILFHTCDTGGGSSGSPLLMDGAHGPEVVGINVGTYVLSRGIPLASSSDQSRTQAIANTAIDIKRIATGFELISARSIVERVVDVQIIQRALRSAKLYSGPINGLWSPRLETAVRAFEANAGQDATGLLTTQLLHQIGGLTLSRFRH